MVEGRAQRSREKAKQSRTVRKREGQEAQLVSGGRWRRGQEHREREDQVGRCECLMLMVLQCRRWGTPRLGQKLAPNSLGHWQLPLFTRKHFWEMKQVHSPRHSPVVALCPGGDFGVGGNTASRSGEKGTVYLRGGEIERKHCLGQQLESAPFLGHGFPFQVGLSYAPSLKSARSRPPRLTTSPLLPGAGL